MDEETSFAIIEVLDRRFTVRLTRVDLRWHAHVDGKLSYLEGSAGTIQEALTCLKERLAKALVLLDEGGV